MFRLKNVFCLIAIVCGFMQIVNAQPTNYKFADRDTGPLSLDVYQPADSVRKDICVLYVFGGGFVQGSKTAKDNVQFFDALVKRGYTVVAIDYRLGLKGVTKVSVLKSKPVFHAVELATEDLVSATDFVIRNQEKLRINTKKIVLVGSSAGAITALQTDYELSNRTDIVSSLPEDFRYAGVVSLAGAIFSTKGVPTYRITPSPTLFYHGTQDKIVVYNKIRFFKKGMFGSKSLIKVFEKENLPYMAVRYVGKRHEVAIFPRFYVQDQICDFIDMAASGKYTNQLDITVSDREADQKFKHI